MNSKEGSLENSTIWSTTKTSLWFSSLHTLGTSVISIPLGLVSSILIARTLGPAGKGSYDLVLVTTTLLSMILGFSIPSGITYVVARGKAALDLLFLKLILTALLQGLLAVMLLYTLPYTGYSTLFLPPQTGNGIITAIVISLVFSLLSGYWRAILIGLQQITLANKADLLSRVLQPVLLLAGIGILILLKHQPSPPIFIWINVAVIILTNLIFLRVLYPSSPPLLKLQERGKGGEGVGEVRSNKPTPESPSPSSPWRSLFYLSTRDTSGFGEILRYAFPCYLANLIQFLNYRLDVFIVSFFVGVKGVGLYTLAVSLAQLIWLISNAAATVLLPRVAALQDIVSENVTRTTQITRVSFWLSFISALFLALLADQILPWVYGEAFRQSITPLLGLLPGIVAFSVVNVLASYIAGIGKPQLNLAVSSVGLVVTVIFDLWLIPRFDIFGAAIASTFSYSISALLTLEIFTRKSKVPVRQVLLLTSEDIGGVILLLQKLVKRTSPQKEG
ncbi:MAG TPA: flippase [Candidatus Limnocylindrales bacterium]|nr:flippase [Candidatus Limnocylindrales bacterium]